MYMNSFCANGFEVDAECNEVHSKTWLGLVGCTVYVRMGVCMVLYCNGE